MHIIKRHIIKSPIIKRHIIKRQGYYFFLSASSVYLRVQI